MARSTILALLMLAGCAREESAAPPPVPAPKPPAPRQETPPLPSPPPPPAPRPVEPAPQNPKDFKFDEVRGDSLPVKAVDDGSKIPAKEHPLIVFAGRETAFKDLLGRHLKGEGIHTLGAGDDANLYVLWGPRAGTPVATATFDRAAGRIVVNVRWTGSGMMKEKDEMVYAGVRFELGTLKPGTVGVWIRESTAVDKEPKLTQSTSFVVN